jgi:hypothetical protein
MSERTKTRRNIDVARYTRRHRHTWLVEIPRMAKTESLENLRARLRHFVSPSATGTIPKS